MRPLFSVFVLCLVAFSPTHAESVATGETGECAPERVYVISLDKKTGDPDVEEKDIKDSRYPHGVVWYQDHSKQWTPLSCETSIGVTIAEALHKATEKDSDLKSLIEAQKRGEVVEVPSAPLNFSSQDAVDAYVPTDEMTTHPRPWDGVDITKYLQEERRKSDEWRTSLLMRWQSPEPPEYPPPLYWKAGEMPDVPLPRERPSAWAQFTDDPKGFTTNLIRNVGWFDYGTASVESDSGYRPNFNQVFSDAISLGNPTRMPPPDFEGTFSSLRGVSAGGLTEQQLNVTGFANIEHIPTPRHPQAAPPVFRSPYAVPDAYTAFKKDRIIGPVVDPTIKVWNWVKSWF